MPPAFILSQDQTLHCKKAAATHRGADAALLQQGFKESIHRSSRTAAGDAAPKGSTAGRKPVRPAFSICRYIALFSFQRARRVCVSARPGLPSHRGSTLPRLPRSASRLGSFSDPSPPRRPQARSNSQLPILPRHPFPRNPARNLFSGSAAPHAGRSEVGSLPVRSGRPFEPRENPRAGRCVEASGC
jgi:hypothetical protein